MTAEARMDVVSMRGVAKTCIPRVSLQHHALPDFFMAIRDTDVLGRNIQLALSLLGGTGKRKHHICMDETCISANYERLIGLRAENGIVFNGGSILVDLGCAYPHISVKAYAVADGQSDRQALGCRAA